VPQSIEGKWGHVALCGAASAVAMQFIVPFMLHPSGFPLQSFYQEWTAFALGAISFLAVLVAQRDRELELPRSVFLPIGISMIVLAQLIMGRLGYWQQGAIGLIYLLWSAALLCVGQVLRRRLGWERFESLVAWSLTAGALASAVIAGLQLADWRLGGLVMPYRDRVYANFGQPNHFANYMCLGLFSVFFLVATRRLNVYAAGTVALLLLVLADLSGSTSIWAYLVAALMLAIWVHYRSRSDQTRSLLLCTILAITALLVLQAAAAILPGAFSLYQGTEFQGTAATRLASYVREGDSAREAIWLGSLLIFKDGVFLGAGIGEFGWNYYLRLSQLSYTLGEITNNAHNILLHFLAEFGLFGVLLLTIGAGLWLRTQFRAEANAGNWWILCLVTVFVLHSLVEYPLWYAQFLGPFALLVGAADTSLLRLNRGAISRLAVGGLSLAIAWSLVSVLGDYRRAERLGIAGQTALERNERILEAARVAGESMFGNFLELGLSRTISIDPEALEAKLQLNTRVLRAFPAVDVAYRQSALLALSGDLEGAYRHWDLASTAFPNGASAMEEAYAKRVSAGQSRLAPLVEYAASRKLERR
jgi:O-antigen ligase